MFKKILLRVLLLSGSLSLLLLSDCIRDSADPDPTPQLTWTSPSPLVCSSGISCTALASTSIPKGGVIHYSIDNDSIATIDQNSGLVSAKSSGSATVTATQLAQRGVNLSASISTTVTITIPFVPSLTWIPANEVRVELCQKFQVSVSSSAPEGGAITYHTKDTIFATVDSISGMVTPLATGQVTVIATQAAKEGVNLKTQSSCKVEIFSLETGAVFADGESAVMTVGSNYFNRPEGDDLELRSLTYSIDKTELASIDPHTGIVTALAPGTVTVTLTLEAVPDKHCRASSSYGVKILDSRYFAYVSVDGTLYTYAAEADGNMVELTGRKNQSVAFDRLIVTPNQKFLYTTNPTHDSIYQFSIDNQGMLTKLGLHDAPFKTKTMDLAITKDGKYLYASSFANSIATLFQYAIGDDGILTPLNPATVDGIIANQLVPSGDGHKLYAFSAFHITTYDISSSGVVDASSAVATYVPDLLLGAICISHDDKFLYSSDPSQPMNIFGTNSDNTLTQSGTGPGNLDGNAFTQLGVTPDGKYLFGASLGWSVLSGFSIAPDGQLTFLNNTSVNQIGDFIGEFSFSPDGKYIYGTYYTGDAVKFQIQADGTLTDPVIMHYPAELNIPDDLPTFPAQYAIIKRN